MNDDPTLTAGDAAGGLSDAEADRLRAVSARIAGAQFESTWQPMVISHAFARRDHMPEARPRVTMQGWIDLDAARSPFLVGGRPGLDDLVIAVRALGWTRELAELIDIEGKGPMATPERAIEIAGWVSMAIEEGRSTEIGMAPPEKMVSAWNGDEGFGEWGPIMACLLHELHIGFAEGLQMDRSRAVALVACLRANQGWKPKGDNYRLRETPREEVTPRA